MRGVAALWSNDNKFRHSWCAKATLHTLQVPCILSPRQPFIPILSMLQEVFIVNIIVCKEISVWDSPIWVLPIPIVQHKIHMLDKAFNDHIIETIYMA